MYFHNKLLTVLTNYLPNILTVRRKRKGYIQLSALNDIQLLSILLANLEI